MSWLSKLVGGVTKSPVGSLALAAAPFALPGVGGLAAKGLGALGAAKKVLPGVGIVAGGTAAGSYLAERFTGTGVKKRRGRGFSSRDIKQTRRMLKLIKDMSKAVPHRTAARTASRSCGCH